MHYSIHSTIEVLAFNIQKADSEITAANCAFRVYAQRLAQPLPGIALRLPFAI